MDETPLAIQMMHILTLSGLYSSDLTNDVLFILLDQVISSSRSFLIGCQFKFLLELALDGSNMENTFISYMVRKFVYQALRSDEKINSSSNILLCYLA